MNEIFEIMLKSESGSTRSEDGRKCRDTFASLKKTCRKHGISFWHYLQDRISGTTQIPQLPELILCGNYYMLFMEF